MIDPKPANTYDARISGMRLVRRPDGRSAFKVYFIDIVGRSDPARYEWDRCPTGRDAFLAALAARRGGGRDS